MEAKLAVAVPSYPDSAANLSWAGQAKDILWGGVDFGRSPYTGGPQCRDYVPGHVRVLSQVVYTSLGVGFLLISRRRTPPRRDPGGAPDNDDRPPPEGPRKVPSAWWSSEGLRLSLLVFYALVNGMELGFKAVDRDMIFILNFCHPMSYLHLYLIARLWDGGASRGSSVRMLEASKYLLFGAAGAFFFPQTETRRWHFQLLSFYCHHSLILLVPIYLSLNLHRDRRNAGSLVEPGGSWCPFIDRKALAAACGTWAAYVACVHPIAYVSLVNLDSVLCPMPGLGVTGPFYHFHLILVCFAYIVASGLLYQCLVRLATFVAVDLKWSSQEVPVPLKNKAE